MVSKKKVLKQKTKRIAFLGVGSILICTFILFSILKIVFEISNKYREASKLENDYILLKEKESDLSNEIDRLNDKDYLARYAREKYFFSKKDEYIMRIPTN